MNIRNALRRCNAAAGILLLLVAALLSASGGAHAQGKVLDSAVLTDQTTETSLVPYTIVQADPENRITEQSILSTNGRILQGKMAKGNYLSLGYDGAPAWIIIKLVNKSRNEDWVLNLGRRGDGRLGRLKKLDAYTLEVRPAAAQAGGGAIALEKLSLGEDHGVFKIRAAPNQNKLILIHLQAEPGVPGVIPLKLHTENDYIQHIAGRSIMNTAYALLLGGIGISVIALSFMRRMRAHAVIGVSFIYAALCWIFYDHIGSTSQMPHIGLILMAMTLAYTLLSILCARIYCSIDYTSYAEKYMLYGLALLNIGCIGATSMLPAESGLIKFATIYGLPTLTFSALALMTFAQSRSGQINGMHYVLSWLFPVGGMIVSLSAALDLISPNILTLNAFWYALPFQAFFTLLAVHNKIAGDADYKKPQLSPADHINLNRLKETKDTADHTRLLKVIEKEREMLAEFRAREASRTEEMRVAKEAADEANREKSAFLAVVSHEIRTPMTGIMGMVRLLLDSNINKQQREYALTIQESSEAMLGLLNDILDFEKIQRGKIELENISVDLHRLIQGVITLMSGHAAQKGILLSARMDEDIPRFVKGDPTRLRQVLLNLMSNAIKFTQEGNVTLMVRNLNPQDAPAPQPGKTDSYMIYFAIQDTGIGISAEGQKNLFNPFAQADATISRKFGGTGLGLAISKGLVERMGSSININSREGEGTTFFFTLEMQKGIAITGEQKRMDGDDDDTRDASTPPLNILAVDDNEINLKVISGFLDGSRHRLTLSRSAEDALRKIDQYPFDLVFMDIELPGLRGNEATKILRAHKSPEKASIPVYAITGNVDSEDTKAYLADGMTGFLAKPIDSDKLKSIVSSVARKSRERKIMAPGALDMLAGPVPDSFAPPPEQAPPAPVQADNAIFNPDMLQSLKDTIGESSLTDLLSDLIQKTEEIIFAMELAVESQDFAAIAARSHELKGMAGNFGLVEISSIAAQAEKKAKQSEGDALGAIVQSLPEASTRAKALLRDWVAN